MSAGKHRILIIDDEPISLKVVTNTLTNAGYDAVMCDSGEKAWALLQTDADFAVIILDRLMPGMDGMALFEKLQTMTELSSIPVIMLTGVDESDEIINAIAAGVFDYLTKPVDQQQLLDLIAKTINRK